MLTLAHIFQKNMVLQRDELICIWGSGEPRKEVHISIQNKNIITTVNKNGEWKSYIPPLYASSKEQLIIKSDFQTIILDDIAVGEVWLAAGQSNVEFQIKFDKYWELEKDYKNNDLRFFDVAEIAYDGQENDFNYENVNIWRKCTSKDISFFSAVGYYFQKELYDNLKVPIGIIGCNWGGTRSCSWISEETLKTVAPEWIDYYNKSIENIDMDKFWNYERLRPINDYSNPNSSIYRQFILKSTPTKEQIEQFIEENNINNTKTYRPQTKPACLYEHMIKKISPYTIKGVLWYQGESDDINGFQYLYKDMLKGIISDYRNLWSNENLPFYIVQLPACESWINTKVLDFVTIRKCQQYVVENTKNTYLCSISDVGERYDLHPKNKKIVGHRLALLVEKYTYNQDILCDAPVIKEAVKRENKIYLSFGNVGDGLKINGDKIESLKVHRNNKEIYFTSTICYDTIVLTFEQEIQDILKISFAQTNWFTVNLYNSYNIPCIPFEITC